MNKIIFTLIAFFAPMVYAKNHDLMLLDCTAKQKILITNSWQTTRLDDYLDGDQESFLIAIKNDELFIDEKSLKSIQQKFKGDDGYEEHGNFSAAPTTYKASYFYEIGDVNLRDSDSQRHIYRMNGVSLQLFRIGGEFHYDTFFHVFNLQSSIYQKFNKNNLKNGYVIKNYIGQCNKSKLKQLF